MATILPPPRRMLWLFLWPALLAGCTLNPAQDDEKETVAPMAAPETLQPATEVYLSPRQEIMHKFLLGEIAVFRHEYSESVTWLLEAAQVARDADLAKRAAQVALYDKNYPNAEKAARLWAALEPDNSEPLQVAAVAALRQERADEALHHLDLLLKQQNLPADEEWQMLVKLLGHDAGPQGVEVMARLADKRPRDVQVLLLYAHLLTENKAFERAQTTLETLLESDPENEKAIPLYLDVLRIRNQEAKAVVWMDALLDKHPDNREWRMMHARLLLRTQDYAAALRQFEYLYKTGPKNSEDLYTLGVVALRAEKYPAARRYLKKLLKQGIQEQRNNARAALGQLAEKENKLNEAIRWYKAVEDDSRHYMNVQKRVIMLLIEQDKSREALQHLRQVRRINPDDATWMQWEAELLILQEKYPQALAIYNQALLETPEDTDVLYMRGMLAEQMGDLAGMERDLRHILALDPDNIEAMNALGYTLADRTDRYEEARELIQKALELRPDAYHILDSMGWVLYRLGKTQQALEYLRRALDTQHDPEVAAHLGEVLWINGNRHEARQVWEDARREFPDDERLLKVMQRFLP